jgi:hypothetical protein
MLSGSGPDSIRFSAVDDHESDSRVQCGGEPLNVDPHFNYSIVPGSDVPNFHRRGPDERKVERLTWQRCQFAYRREHRAVSVDALQLIVLWGGVNVENEIDEWELIKAEIADWHGKVRKPIGDGAHVTRLVDGLSFTRCAVTTITGIRWCSLDVPASTIANSLTSEAGLSGFFRAPGAFRLDGFFISSVSRPPER